MAVVTHEKIARQGLFKKYRAIVIAISLFLLFDLGVLGVNFYSSYQINEYAVSINLSGRQRMLSQRMAKALLTLQNDLQLTETREKDIQELKLVVNLFDSTLKGFQIGATVTGGSGQQVYLNKVETDRGQEIIKEAYAIWMPYLQTLQPFLVGQNFSEQQLHGAVQYASANNLKLLNAMNDLTTDLEQTADRKSLILRWIQTIGILAALINFSYTVFMSIRDLIAGDRQIERARKETEEILATVKEGLFLLDREFCIGSQHSKSLKDILQREFHEGDELLPILRNMVSGGVYAAAKDYIELLFGNRVKEALVLSLNPLNQVEVRFDETTGAFGLSRPRYLSFHFNRAFSDGQISHLLVTVQDVTEQVELAQQLDKAKSQARLEIDALLRLMNNDAVTLQQFMGNVQTTLDQINEYLRVGGGNPRSRQHAINHILRKVHGIKGEAATLGVEMLEAYAHQFEKSLIEVRDHGEVSGDDMLRVTVLLDGFYEQLSSIRRVINRFADIQQNTSNSEVQVDTFADNLQQLAQRIAADQQKTVRVVTELDALKELPLPVVNDLENVTIQLLRNAVTHGIEPLAERAELEKPSNGMILVRCKKIASNQFEFILRDDGRGIVLQNIRLALINGGRKNQRQVDAMDARSVLLSLFKPGFSTAIDVSRDAGHGIGLDIVAAKVKAIRGQLRLVSRVNEFTEFRIKFSV